MHKNLLMKKKWCKLDNELDIESKNDRVKINDTWREWKKEKNMPLLWLELFLETDPNCVFVDGLV